MSTLSQLPSINDLLLHLDLKETLENFGRPFTLMALNAVLDDIRKTALEEDEPILPDDEIIKSTRDLLNIWTAPAPLTVINATGVILHTNLGRAPLSEATRRAISVAAGAYTNLEFNLETGKRGKRSMHAASLLSKVTKAESGFVVNNNAGAVLLALSALAGGKNVVVSRTQLVEIGGGFRIPDVMRQSGANLLEIGTTNRVHLYDFENALENQEIALVLIAHHSNFKVIGFHSEPGLDEIVQLAHQYEVPVVHDIGSGALLDTADYGLAHEPTIQESLGAGCDLVCFSGDKLLGGPQAGIIIGREDLLVPIRKHPLARALRAGKLTLSGVNANLLHYLKDEAESEVPIWRMIATSQEALKTTAENWREYLGAGEVIQGQSTVGGGSLPTEELPTVLLALPLPKPNQVLRHLRNARIPVIARIEDDLVLLDPRTVLPDQEAPLLRTLREVLEKRAA